MRSTLLAATSAFALALTAVSPALAQDAPAPAAPAPQAGNGRQVLTFTPDFFADQQSQHRPGHGQPGSGLQPG